MRPETLERAERGAGLSVQETKELASEIAVLREALETIAALAPSVSSGDANFARMTAQSALVSNQESKPN